MKLSHGLKLLLAPLASIAHPLGYQRLYNALYRIGKRGKDGTYYPTDFKRINLILETTSEITGKHFEVVVKDGNVQRAIDLLSLMLRHETFFQTMEALANPTR